MLCSVRAFSFRLSFFVPSPYWPLFLIINYHLTCWPQSICCALALNTPPSWGRWKEFGLDQGFTIRCCRSWIKRTKKFEACGKSSKSSLSLSLDACVASCICCSPTLLRIFVVFPGNALKSTPTSKSKENLLEHLQRACSQGKLRFCFSLAIFAISMYNRWMTKIKQKYSLWSQSHVQSWYDAGLGNENE